jgi:DNA-binding protein H-NS
MAQTYAQLQDQIAKLQAKADSVRNEELAAVMARIREDIKAYKITMQDLFGKSVGAARKGKAKSSRQAKYGDGAGNVWVGRGPRPQWLRDALAAGKKLEEFVFGALAPAAPAAPAVRKSAKKSATAKKVSAKKATTRKTAANG